MAEYYHMDHVNLKLPITEPIDVDKAEEAIKADPEEFAVLQKLGFQVG